ncbi:MAG: RpiB/LacA/LacB family sugar-phosphate isomerase [Bacteroidota bacterium]
MRIALASDHVGFILKEQVGGYLREAEFEVWDLDTDSPEPMEYPNFARAMLRLTLTAVNDSECLMRKRYKLEKAKPLSVRKRKLKKLDKVRFK